MRSTPVPRERRHTLYFLEQTRGFAPVFLDTDVDMSRVREHRAGHREAGHSYSLVSYVALAAGRALAAHPDANAAIRGRLRPRVAHYPSVDAKITLDRVLNGRRVVLATVVPRVHTAGIDEIQDRLRPFRDGDPAQMPEFAKVRLLHRLPMPLGRLAFRLATRPLARRAESFGTVAITSLGHRPVHGFHSVGGTTITLGVGQVRDVAVVRDERVVVRPIMRLSLAFDHRVIDGAEAADVLTDIKDNLETLASVGEGEPRSGAAEDRLLDAVAREAPSPVDTDPSVLARGTG
ncbi:2-oxo acid dehydrogenase subunit E2 [Embleya sp. NPDC020630]|uniref:2-oxo acid dehydrogenase subunit E2 n=1 Tax=Embleya sp. NPDC020630 TaxID=3363979 RepID=UPI0037A8C43B